MTAAVPSARRWSINASYLYTVTVLTREDHFQDACIIKKLVIQNYNHPLICFWGIFNETLIGGLSNRLEGIA